FSSGRFSERQARLWLWLWLWPWLNGLAPLRRRDDAGRGATGIPARLRGRLGLRSRSPVDDNRRFGNRRFGNRRFSDRRFSRVWTIDCRLSTVDYRLASVDYHGP